MNLFYLSLGSNLDPEENLLLAIEELSRRGKVTATSTIWETAPIGPANQPNYLNAVIILRSKHTIQDFQDQVIPEIETALKRVRGPEKYGPRTIDIDILMVNDEVLALGHRRIPSPEILERPFVAIPLAEIAPNLRHPITGEKIETIAKKFSIEPASMFPRVDLSFQDLIF